MNGALAVALVAMAVAGCAGDDLPTSTDSTAAGPAATAVTAVTAAGRQPKGFTTVTLELSGADPCCVWLADSPDERRRGLMDVTDLGEPVGMLFAYTDEQTGRFYMFKTVLPLSIAYFDGDGRFVSSTDMEPCRSADPDDCPRFAAEAPFRYALEVPKGGLDDLGIGRGTTMTPGSEAGNCSS